uniref:Uncharacterized protein n=1 Tax=Ditylenchus dipsaci TaxID=166011 RepID=A0A915CYB6_9BILA
MTDGNGSAMRNLQHQKCCAHVVAENKKLMKALEKEKQRKLYVMTAYKKLLAAYQSVVDLKEVMDSSDSEYGNEKENIGPQPENNGSLNRSSPMDNQMIEEQDLAENHMDFNQNNETNRISGRKISCLRRPASFHSSQSHISAHSKQKQMSEWYFLAMEDEYEISKKLEENNKIDALLKKSGERSKMIANTSQRRATIAANRRAIVVDIIKGKRQLDDEALKILHTDSSQISAFPKHFIKEMEEKAKSKYKQSQLRLEQERGYYRERQLEIVTNRILAHSSAAIAKTVANSRLSRTFSSLNVGQFG